MTAVGRSMRALAALLLVLLAAQLWADPPGVPAAERMLATDVAKWIRELDDDEFQVRQRATAKLEKAGPPVYAALAAAMPKSSFEVRTRTLGILARAYQAEAPGRKEAARKVLEQLARPESGTVAAHARAILRPLSSAFGTPDQIAGNTPPIPVPFGRQQMAGIPGQGVLLLQGNIQIRAQLGRGVRTVQIQAVGNGTRTIDVRRPNKRIRIEEDPRGRIKMSVTETINGRSKTAEYAAKDVDELKQKHPEAYKIYQAEHHGK